LNQEWLYRKIIITGANGGIGLAIARAFLGEGATVILPVHNNAGNIDALVEEFGSTQVYPFQLDLRRIEAIEEFAGKVQKQFGTVDV
jgi:NAD(P)-dependent dehydrogenase (short-subunit alcohol dehydrogenase family)